MQTYNPVDEVQLLPDPGFSSIRPVPLEFEFPFFGHYYDTVLLNVDGFLQFTNDQLPWPYLLDYKLHLKNNRIISPLTNEDFIIEPNNEDGAWYEGDAEHATFRWKLTWEGNVFYTTFDFSVTLFSSGEVTFNFGKVSTDDYGWISGISAGDKKNYLMSPVDHLEGFSKYD